MDLLIESPPPIGSQPGRAWRSTADFWRRNGAALAGAEADTVDLVPPATTLHPGELRVQLSATFPVVDTQTSVEARTVVPGWGDRPFAGFAAVVAETRADTPGLAVGDEIFGIAEVASLQCDGDSLIVSARVVARKPTGLSCQESASVALDAVSAWQMLFKLGQLEAGETALILGADTTVGRLAIQLAAAHGVRTVAMALPEDMQGPKCASRVIDSSAGCLEAQSRLAAVIVDTVGGVPYQRARKAMRHGCTLVSCVERPAQSSRAGARFYRPEAASAACLARIAELIDAGVLDAFKRTE
jgi:NADPH:quinone reductase-like Zn-dependent oxidoreductase